MKKIFKVFEDTPRSISDYERAVLEQCVTDQHDADPLRARNAILEEARAEAEEKIREAYTEGLRRGMEAGMAKFQESVGQSADALNKSAAAIKEAHEALLDSLGPQVVELVAKIAGRILGRESRMDPELIQTVARRALEHLTDRERLVVHVNARDLEALRAQKAALIEEFDGVREIQVLADPAVSPGGCIVESELVHIDARLESQLEEILSVLDAAPLDRRPE